MADNYLERRMEELRAGRLGGELEASRRRRALKARRLSGIHALVIGSGPLAAEAVMRLTRRGATVDIIDADRRRGSAVAQRHGACFRPVDAGDRGALELALDSVASARGEIHLILTDGSSEWSGLCRTGPVPAPGDKA